MVSKKENKPTFSIYLERNEKDKNLSNIVLMAKYKDKIDPEFIDSI